LADINQILLLMCVSCYVVLLTEHIFLSIVYKMLILSEINTKYALIEQVFCIYSLKLNALFSNGKTRLPFIGSGVI